MRIREWIAGILAMLVMVSSTMAAQAELRPVLPAEPVPSPPPVSMGSPLRDPVRSAVQAQGVDAAGNPQAYWITDGKDGVPATFQVTDVRTGERIFDEQVASGILSHAIAFSENKF